MHNITYKMDCNNVNWAEMRQTLIEDDFDNERTVEQYKISFENSAKVCIAYDGDKIIGTVRALSDGVCNAYIVDVWTLSAYRKQGIAREMMRLVTDQLQGQHVYLFTDDMMAFYDKLGFKPDGVGMSIVVGDWLQNETR